MSKVTQYIIPNGWLSILPMLLIMLAFQINAFAAIEQRTFDDPSLNDRYSSLIAELRCLVCQNQNLADSNAALARDLRDKTAEMLISGKSDQEILDYMSDRYGDFVLYRPPFRKDTLALWLGPLALLILVVGFLLRHLLKSQRQETLGPTQAPDNEEQTKVRNLMKNSPRLNHNKDSQR